MRSSVITTVRVGLVVGVALVLLTSFIWTLGQETKLWEPKVSFITRFRNVVGLNEGSDVRLAGYPIGYVTDISLPEEVGSPLIQVNLAIEKRSADWIRTDTQARVKTLGLLGDKYIELTQGSREASALEPGSEIPVVQPIDIENLLESGENIADNVLVATSALRKIAEKIERGEGFIGELIGGSERSRAMADDLVELVRAVSEVAQRIQRGEGVLGMLVGGDPRGAQLKGDLQRLLSNLSTLAEALNSGEGLLGRVLKDDAYAEQVLGNVKATSEQLVVLSERLNSSEGLVGRLLEDEQLADQLVGDLERTVKAMADVTERISEGEGTLGKLVADETLYQGLNDILAGAHKSRLTRWVLQTHQKRGAEDRIEAETEERGE